MNTIAVIGAGTMGNGIAHTFAQSGFTVKLIDISDKSLEKGMATIAANLDRMVTKGTITEDDKIKRRTQLIQIWDEIENQLNNPKFWAFISNESLRKYSNKIEYFTSHLKVVL